MAETVRAHRDPELRAVVTSVRPLPGVRAGSGLAAVETGLLVVQDDSTAFAIVDPAGGSVRRDPDDRAMTKLDKPDYEAALRLPDGRVVVFGSGATPRRRELAIRGTDGNVERRPAAALYALIEQRLDTTPNLEAAVQIDETVRLFHRGVEGDGASATLDVPLAAIDGGPPSCSPPRFHDLGRLGGAVLGFTAAAVGRSGRIFYVAAAEHTPDPVSDGPVAGAALGVIDGDVVRWTPLLEGDGTLSRRKPEGLLLDASEREGWLVTDPDDAEEPAQLLRFRLDGLW
jgi:hypothetical protein